jgi:hypothetical protein
LLALPDKVQYLRAVIAQLERVSRGDIDPAVDHDLADFLVVLGVGSVISQVDEPAYVLAKSGDLLSQIVEA